MWTPRFTQVDFFTVRFGSIPSLASGSLTALLAGGLLLALWLVMLRWKPSAPRLAIGLAALALCPNAVLATSCGWLVSHAHPSWQMLLLAVPVLSILVALLGAGWIALFWRAARPNECGRCRHELQDSQAICPECGWQRGRPRGVGQARWHALAVCGAFSAFVSLVVLRIGLAIPLEWTAKFSAQVHDAASGPSARVFGRFRQRMAAGDVHWDPVDLSGISFSCEPTPNSSIVFGSIDGDLSAYPPEALAGLEARLVREAEQADPGAPRDRIESMVNAQAAFVRGVRSIEAVRGTDRSPWSPPVDWVGVEVFMLQPPLPLVVASAASGPLAALALALLVRRHQRA